MTRDGLTEENLRDGSVKDISHRSRGRPENKEEFVPERERKKAENEDSKSGKGKRLQMEKIRKSSARQEAVEDTVEVTPEEKVSGYRKKLHRYEKIPDDDNNLNSQKKSIRKKQLQKQMTKEQAKAGRLSFDDEGNQMVKGAGMKPGGTAGKYIAIGKANRDILYWRRMGHMKLPDTCSLNHGEISKTGWKIRLQKERIFRKELIGLCIHLSLIIP